MLTSACGIEKSTESSSGVCGGGDVKLALSLEVRRGCHSTQLNDNTEQNDNEHIPFLKEEVCQMKSKGTETNYKFHHRHHRTLG